MEIITRILIFLISLPVEMCYLGMAMCFAKKTKKHIVLFPSLLTVVGMLCFFLSKWQLWYYIAFIAMSYIIMRILYKSHISDIFVFLLFFAWLAITSYVVGITIGYGLMGLIVQRLLLFSIFALREKFNTWYNLYRELWNRRDDGRIKSITLRNISLLFLNTFIVFMNYLLIFLNNNLSK